MFKKIITVMILVFGLSLITGCETVVDQYEILNQVLDLNNNSNYSGYLVTIGESSIKVEKDNTSNIIKYTETQVLYNEYPSSSETTTTIIEEYYSNNERYYKEDNIWKKEAKSYQVVTLSIKEEYFNDPTIITTSSEVTFTGRVKPESVEAILGSQYSEVTMTIKYDVTTSNLTSIVIDYLNEYSNAMKIEVVVSYEDVSLELPEIE